MKKSVSQKREENTFSFEERTSAKVWEDGNSIIQELYVM